MSGCRLENHGLAGFAGDVVSGVNGGRFSCEYAPTFYGLAEYHYRRVTCPRHMGERSRQPARAVVDMAQCRGQRPPVGFEIGRFEQKASQQVSLGQWNGGGEFACEL